MTYHIRNVLHSNELFRTSTFADNPFCDLMNDRSTIGGMRRTEPTGRQCQIRPTLQKRRTSPSRTNQHVRVAVCKKPWPGGTLARKTKTVILFWGKIQPLERNVYTSRCWVIFASSQDCRKSSGTHRKSILHAAKSFQMPYTATTNTIKQIRNQIKHPLALRLGKHLRQMKACERVEGQTSPVRSHREVSEAVCLGRSWSCSCDFEQAARPAHRFIDKQTHRFHQRQYRKYDTYMATYLCA
jgi:hypothetical protein